MLRAETIRGYRANLQGAVNACENGATVELDLKTAQVLVEICRQAEDAQAELQRRLAAEHTEGMGS